MFLYIYLIDRGYAHREVALSSLLKNHFLGCSSGVVSFFFKGSFLPQKGKNAGALLNRLRASAKKELKNGCLYRSMRLSFEQRYGISRGDVTTVL